MCLTTYFRLKSPNVSVKKQYYKQGYSYSDVEQGIELVIQLHVA